MMKEKEMITEQYRELIRHCEQCGTCTASCPTSDLSEFNIRKLVRYLQLEMHEDKDFLNRYPWLCTLCYRCKVLCTEGLDIPKLVFALRELAHERKWVPKGANDVLDSIKTNQSPYIMKGSKTTRINPPLQSSENSKTLFWVGCTPSIRAPSIASATAQALTKFGDGYKILENEPCCGEPLICLGYLDEARSIALDVKKEIEEANVDQLVAPCSGCYNAFIKLYPEILGVEISGVEILHSSQFLIKNLDKIKLENPMTVTYHDPCTLGRHAGVYDEPRKVLESIEGVTLKEMDKTREFSTCCGGGGGLPSLEPKMALNIALGKLEREVLPLGVDALVTGCPMCHLNFKLNAAKKKLPLKVYDLSEIVSMGTRI
jgi:heterodisulfide reductase subunit D